MFAFNKQAQTATNKNNSMEKFMEESCLKKKTTNNNCKARSSTVITKLGLFEHVINNQPPREPLMLFSSSM